MVTSNIADWGKYDFNNEKFKAAFAFLRQGDLLRYQPGTQLQICDGVLAKFQEYVTDPEETRRFERHRHHFDIQFVVKGEEFVGIVPVAGLETDGEYNAADDLIYFKTPVRHGGAVLHDGDFVVVSPDDAHRPNCMVTKPSAVRKIVVKVDV